MNRYILLIALSCLLLTSGTCKKEDGEKPPYFNCDYYHYFPDDGFPVLTPEDSTATAEFLVSSGLYSRQFLEWDVVSRSTPFFYLPYIKNNIDTALFNSYLIGVKNKLNPIYHSLNWYNLFALIMSDAVVTGKIIDMQYIRDSTKCTFYKTLYIVQIDDVLYSRFPLKKSNYILGGLDAGFTGGCTPPNMEEAFSFDSFMSIYKSGDEELFAVSKQDYRRLFIGDSYLTGTYKDNYCPNMFRMMANEGSWNISILNDVRKFYKEH